MPKPLRVVANNATTVLQALREALDGGDAILPLPDTKEFPELPDEVSSSVALVVQTSGSTGLPKQVALSANALLASAAAAESALGGPGQWLLALPVNYIAGINVLVRSITAATDPVRLTSPHFDPQAFVAAADALAHPVRYTSLVPAQLSSLLDFAPAVQSLRRFDRVLIGGQSMPQELRGRALDHGISVTRTYGSSETSGGCVYDGVPVGETYMRIVDGEVELGGPTLADGYLNDEERTARSFYSDDAGRWYRTADLGRIDNGVLTVTGRRDDVIVSGGIKVSLAAVERVVRSIPKLSDAVVVRGADERWGEVPIVFATTDVALSAVRETVGAELGAAARPAEIVVVGSIPVLASGKPDRASLERR